MKRCHRNLQILSIPVQYDFVAAVFAVVVVLLKMMMMMMKEMALMFVAVAPLAELLML